MNGRGNKEGTTINFGHDGVIAFGLFLVALLPRIFGLGKFITGDEPRWVVRSMSFLTGLLTVDWPLTLHTGHPGVTTMWSGSLGLILNYGLNHRAEGALLTFVQGLPQDWERIDPTILPWMRLPIVLLAALSIAILFWLFRSVDRNAALIAALLLAFHPFHLGNSQLLHHDALVSIFSSLAILLLLTALRSWSWKWIIISGMMSGLAILSKSTAYALIPFVALTMLIEAIYQRITWRRAVLGGLSWGLIALMTVVLLWPAIWVVPTEVWQIVFGWATESANVGDVSNTLVPRFDQRFPDLGIFFYPINWILKTTPLMMLGLLLFPRWWRKESRESPARWWTLRLLLWIGLFSLMLALGDKRDGRYLLPIYFALCILAAFGLKTIYQDLKRRRPFVIRVRSLHTDIYQVVFVILLLGFSVAYYPYYLAYYNPFIGGPWLAPRLVKVGLGDGMEQAAAWLNVQPDANRLRVATDLGQTFQPFFRGHATNHDTFEPFSADYVLTYIRQIQNGIPFSEYWPYYQARPPVYQLKIGGIDYLWLHKEPPLVTVGRIPFSDDLILRAYTIDQRLAVPGTLLNVTLIWRTQMLTDDLARLQLRDGADQVWAVSAPSPVIDPEGPSAVEGHYTLTLPPNIPRGEYHLWATVGNNQEWTEIAAVPVGRVQPTQAVAVPIEANFAHQIALRGFEVSNHTPSAGETLTLNLHWQALYFVPYSYTTFVHLLDSAGNVVAQSDVLPGQGQWPTDTWQPNEWITDQVSLSLPVTIPAGEYQILVGWYHVETGQRLPLIDDNSGQNSVTLGTVTAQ